MTSVQPPGTVPARTKAPSPLSRSAILTVVLGYSIFGALWILVSDRTLEFLLRDPALITLASTLKGWAFIGITALLLYHLLRRLATLETPARTLVTPVHRSLRLPVALAVATAAALTVVTLAYDFSRHKEKEVTRLQVAADLKTRQVADWLRERQGDAAFLQGSRLLAQNYQRWRERGDTASRDELLARLEQFRAKKGYMSAALLDERGDVLWDSSGRVSRGDLVPQLKALQAAALNQYGQSAPYRDGNGRTRIDVIGALVSPDNRPGPKIILSVDVNEYLFPTLKIWSVPGSSAETLLFRRDSADVLYLNDLAHRPDAAAQFRLPITTPKLLGAQLLRGEVKPGELIEGVDYRDVPALGVARAVPGTDWFLITKLDRSEVLGEIWRDSLWIMLTSLLSLFVIAVGAVMYRQRLSLQESRRVREDYAEKLRALQLLEALADESEDCIFVKDAEGRYLLFNRAGCEMIGKSPDEVLGHDAADLFPPDEATMLRACDHEAMAGNQSHSAEMKLTTVTGVRTLHITRGPLHDDEGRVIGVFGISRDISARKQMELDLQASAVSLKQSLSRAQLLLDSALDAVICMDQDGLVTAWNHHAEVIFGYPADQALGRPMTDLIVPVMYRERHRQGLARYVESGLGSVIGRRVEWSALRADGTEFPVEMTIGAIHDGDRLMFSAYIQDITERRRSEETLRKLSQAVEQSPESIVITNVGGSIEYVNEAFCRTTGYLPEDVIGQNPRILHSGNTPAGTYLSMWQTLTKGMPWKGEFYNRRKDGSEYIEFAIITPLRQADGRVTHYVAVKEDISEKKRIGHELDQHRHHLEELVASRTAQLEEARQKAEVANLAKSSFLANMSHEIRTPMNAIVGLTHILRRGNPTPEQADKLSRIVAAADHLLSIVNDVLDLSKIETGKLILEQTDFSLAAILDHTRSMIAEQARAKNLTLRVECEAVPLWLRGDPTRLRQAMLNLAGNAVKFTEKGAITMRARLEPGSLPPEEAHGAVTIRFEVEDTGIGISPDKLPELFQSFVQADATTTRKFGGTGLGLAITRRLAYLMGGDAGVQSRPEQGSTFWFTARLGIGHGIQPAHPLVAGGMDNDAEAELRQRHGGARLLLAEDNMVNREVALELIHAAGLVADTAENGRVAVTRAEAVTYDLILMDVQMPEMNGLDATRAIRRQPHGATIPILAMTANAFDEDRKACKDAGMSDFVAKPVNPEAFYAALLKWLPASKTVPIPDPVKDPAMKSDDNTLRQSLAAIPGLDLESGLTVIRGNLRKYTQLLVLFAEGHGHHAEQIVEMARAKSLADIGPIAHSLRGSASMLGATRVSVAAEAILSALHGNASAEDIGPLCSVLAEDLSRLVAGIRQAAKGLADNADTQPDMARLNEVLGHLEDLLEHGDIAAGYLAKEQLGLLREAFGERANSLLACIEAFDFEHAGMELHELREQPRARAAQPA